MELDQAGIGRATLYKYSPDAEAVLPASDLAGEVVNEPAKPWVGGEGVLPRAQRWWSMARSSSRRWQGQSRPAPRPGVHGRVLLRRSTPRT